MKKINSRVTESYSVVEQFQQNSILMERYLLWILSISVFHSSMKANQHSSISGQYSRIKIVICYKIYKLLIRQNQLTNKEKIIIYKVKRRIEENCYKYKQHNKRKKRIIMSRQIQLKRPHQLLKRIRTASSPGYSYH